MNSLQTGAVSDSFEELRFPGNNDLQIHAASDDLSACNAVSDISHVQSIAVCEVTTQATTYLLSRRQQLTNQNARYDLS